MRLCCLSNSHSHETCFSILMKEHRKDLILITHERFFSANAKSHDPLK